jgi:hypothetical protein
VSARRSQTVTEILNLHGSVTGVCSARRGSTRIDSVPPATEIITRRRTVAGRLQHGGPKLSRKSSTLAGPSREFDQRGERVPVQIPSPQRKAPPGAEPSLGVVNTEVRIRAESACAEAVIGHYTDLLWLQHIFGLRVWPSTSAQCWQRRL